MITIDKNKCKRCNACVMQCPYNFIFNRDKEGYPKSNNNFDSHCIECFHCVLVCPSHSLSHPKCIIGDCENIDKEDRISKKQLTSLLKSRRSLRAFKKKPINQEILNELMDLTRWSSTAVNSQEIKWLVINNSEKIQTISGYIIDWLREIKSSKELIDAWDNGKDIVLRDAPHLAIALFNRDRYWAFSEASSALTYLELAASSFGIGACWAGYFTKAVNDYKPLKDFLKISEDDQVYGAMMLGIPKVKTHFIPKRNKIDITWDN